MSIVKSSSSNLTLNADGANNDVIIQSNGSTKVTVDGATGNLGVGQVTPAAKLDIKKSSGAGYAAYIVSSVNVSGSDNGLFIGGYDEHAGSKLLTVQSNAITPDDGSYHERLVVQADGNVGISTTPTQKLDVSGHLLFGNGRSNSAEKHGRFTAINYNTAVNPMCVIYANGASSGNFVRFGGGTDSVSPVTSFQFFTATGTPANGEGTKRATLDSDGLKFGVDTAASNALSDYEEGNFTPSWSPTSGQWQGTGTGKYTKIGRQVTASFKWVASNQATGSKFNSVGGLPFTSLNETTTFAATCTLNGAGQSGQTLMPTLGANSTSVGLQMQPQGTGAHGEFTPAQTTTNTVINLTVTYMTP